MKGMAISQVKARITELGNRVKGLRTLSRGSKLALLVATAFTAGVVTTNIKDNNKATEHTTVPAAIALGSLGVTIGAGKCRKKKENELTQAYVDLAKLQETEQNESEKKLAEE